ncbi:MAG: hypothetical protein QM765_34955 [Myxococcales bacterium]
MRTFHALVTLVLLACTGCDGPKPPVQPQEIDWTGDFSGQWYGTVSTDGGPLETTAPSIRVNGSNQLLLPGPGDLVATAVVMDSISFQVRTSPLVPDGESVASITGGWGYRDGEHLTYVIQGRRGTGTSGVQADFRATYDLVRHLPPPAPTGFTAVSRSSSTTARAGPPRSLVRCSAASPRSASRPTASSSFSSTAHRSPTGCSTRSSEVDHLGGGAPRSDRPQTAGLRGTSTGPPAGEGRLARDADALLAPSFERKGPVGGLEPDAARGRALPCRSGERSAASS